MCEQLLNGRNTQYCGFMIADWAPPHIVDFIVVQINKITCSTITTICISRAILHKFICIYPWNCLFCKICKKFMPSKINECHYTMTTITSVFPIHTVQQQMTTIPMPSIDPAIPTIHVIRINRSTPKIFCIVGKYTPSSVPSFTCIEKKSK